MKNLGQKVRDFRSYAAFLLPSPRQKRK
jgi:hypothetical protein